MPGACPVHHDASKTNIHTIKCHSRRISYRVACNQISVEQFLKKCPGILDFVSASVSAQQAVQWLRILRGVLWGSQLQSKTPIAMASVSWRQLYPAQKACHYMWARLRLCDKRTNLHELFGALAVTLGSQASHDGAYSLQRYRATSLQVSREHICCLGTLVR